MEPALKTTAVLGDRVVFAGAGRALAPKLTAVLS